MPLCEENDLSGEEEDDPTDAHHEAARVPEIARDKLREGRCEIVLETRPQSQVSPSILVYKENTPVNLGKPPTPGCFNPGLSARSPEVARFQPVRFRA